jgi:acetyl-CoA carboxylase biotin carboxyl carrier protein
MDLKDIQELIKFVAKSGATEVDLEIDNIKISIKSPEKKRRGEADEITTIIQQQNPAVMLAPAVTATAIASTPEVDENANYITIKSTMIGTFYRSSSPREYRLIFMALIILLSLIITCPYDVRQA